MAIPLRRRLFPSRRRCSPLSRLLLNMCMQSACVCTYVCVYEDLFILEQTPAKYAYAECMRVCVCIFVLKNTFTISTLLLNMYLRSVCVCICMCMYMMMCYPLSRLLLNMQMGVQAYVCMCIDMSVCSPSNRPLLNMYMRRVCVFAHVYVYEGLLPMEQTPVQYAFAERARMCVCICSREFVPH